MTTTQAGKTLATSIVLEYEHLVAGKNMQHLIEQAYGPKGMLVDR